MACNLNRLHSTLRIIFVCCTCWLRDCQTETHVTSARSAFLQAPTEEIDVCQRKYSHSSLIPIKSHPYSTYQFIITTRAMVPKCRAWIIMAHDSKKKSTHLNPSTYAGGDEVCIWETNGIALSSTAKAWRPLIRLVTTRSLTSMSLIEIHWLETRGGRGGGVRFSDLVNLMYQQHVTFAKSTTTTNIQHIQNKGLMLHWEIK